MAPSAADGREKILTPTRRAVEFIAARREATGRIESQLRSELGAEQVDELIAVLEAMAMDETSRSIAGPVAAAALRALRLLEVDELP